MNQQLIDNNFLFVPKFITAEEAENLAQEFYIAQRDQKLVLDPQCPSSPAAYNLMPCVKLLVKKVPHISALVKEDVLPTYTYGRIYVPGEVLARHRDRDACEISLTVNLQHSGKDWPIFIENPSGEKVSLILKPGDAMLYLGCLAAHWRDKFEGEVCVQAFMHYVLANGSRSYAYFDRVRI